MSGIDIKRELQGMIEAYSSQVDRCRKELEEGYGKLLHVERIFNRSSISIYTCVVRDLQCLVRQLDHLEDCHD